MQLWMNRLAVLLLLVLLPASSLASNRYGLPGHADDATCEALAVRWYETVHRPSLPAPTVGASYDGWGREIDGPGRIVATGGIDGYDNSGQWWLSQGALDWVRAQLEASAAPTAPSPSADLSTKGPASETTEKTDPSSGDSDDASEETESAGSVTDTPMAPTRVENDAFAGLGADASEDVPDLTADSKAQKALAIALKQVGKPYVWGNEGPDSFDCSGLMYYSYGKVGIRLPRVARNQAKKYPKVSLDELQPGDLIFFHDYGHVGMYVGDGKYVHAPGRGKTVRVESLSGADVCDAGRVV